MKSKNIIIKVVSVIMALTVAVVSISGCNLVKQTGGKGGASASDISLDKDNLCCPNCSSTDISGPDADGNYVCNSCGEKWAYNTEKNEIDLKDENGNTVGTADISAGVKDTDKTNAGGSGSGSGSGSNYRPNNVYTTQKPYNTTKKPGTTTTTKTTKKRILTLQDIVAMGKDVVDIFNAGIGNVVMDKNGNLTVDNHPGKDTGLLGYKYSTTEKCFITAEDSWQRNFGFEETYDSAAGLGAMSYDTIRVFFNYEGLDWMIQMWKGQYGFVLIGAEIGLYTRPEGTGTGTYYNCAEDDVKLTMSMDIYRRESSTSSKFNLLFSRNPFRTWWLTGFVPGTLKAGTYVVPEDQTKHLRQDCKIVFDTPEQAQAFIGGLKKVDFIYHNSPDRKRAIEFKEFGYADYDEATSVSAKYALESDGRTVRFSWR